jgi:hypothetical protein
LINKQEKKKKEKFVSQYNGNLQIGYLSTAVPGDGDDSDSERHDRPIA